MILLGIYLYLHLKLCIYQLSTKKSLESHCLEGNEQYTELLNIFSNQRYLYQCIAFNYHLSNNTLGESYFLVMIPLTYTFLLNGYNCLKNVCQSMIEFIKFWNICACKECVSCSCSVVRMFCILLNLWFFVVSLTYLRWISCIQQRFFIHPAGLSLIILYLNHLHLM